MTGVLLLREQRVSLDLHDPARIQERRDDEHGARRANVAEDLAVGASAFRGTCGVEQEGSRAHDMLRCGAGLAERGHDDLEAAPGLAVRVAGRIAAVRHYGAGAGNEDVTAVAHRPREADRLLVWRAGSDEPASHASSLARRWRKHFGRSRAGPRRSRLRVSSGTAMSSRPVGHGTSWCAGHP